VSFDFFDPDWARDPFPMYDDLRENSPVYRSELGMWMVSRHADCLAVLRDRAASSDAINVNPERMPEGFRPGIDPDDPMAAAMRAARPFLFMDPPDHTRLRGLVAKAFTPKVVESLRPRTQVIVDELLDGIAATSGPVDLVRSFAYPLPVRVICDLLGVPFEDQELFGDWSAALARGLDPDFLLSPEVIAERQVALGQFTQYFFELLSDRRKNPGDDLLSALVAVEEEGEVLTEVEMLSTSILLLVAGHETTVNLISGGIVALLDFPEQRARFQEDPSVARTGVDELLRYVSPVQLTGRSLLADLEVGGITIPAGDFVMLLLASANHDPQQFDDPESLDVARTPNNHLGFGFGLHHCLGAPLARMETQVAVTSLMRRFPDLTLAVDRPEYRSHVILRGMEVLPVTVGA